MAELDSGIIKKTQDTLGKFVKKPALTDKLLKKPPFRFLHDIITSVIQNFGFFEGLFDQNEMVSANIKDKDGKILFLQKVIDVVKVSMKENVSAKPSKIVAGHEPEKTNELLQLIGMALDQKINSTDAVKLVRGGSVPKSTKKSSNLITQSSVDSVKTKSKSNDNAKTKTLKDNNKIVRKAKESNEKNTEKPLKDSKEKETKNMKISRDTKKSIKEVNSDERTKREKEKLKTDVEVKKSSSKSKVLLETIPIDDLGAGENKNPMGEKVIKPDEDNNLQRSFEPEIVSIQVQSGLTKPNNEINSQQNIEPLKDEVIQKQKSAKKSERKIEKSISSEIVNDDGDAAHQSELDAESQPALNSKDETQQNEVLDESDKVVNQHKSSRKTKNKKEFSEVVESNSNDDKIEKSSDKNKLKNILIDPPHIPSIPRPRTSLRPPSVRPASARPGAPRRRDKNIEIILQPDGNMPKPSTNIKIGDLNIDLDDDGENLVIIEDSTSLTNDNKLATDVLNEIQEEQQGHLVQQILETQKEFLKIDEDTNEIKRKTEIEWDSSNSQQRHSSAKQMDSLRDSIQKLTKSVNPLGKLMDFLQEDIDSMQMELSMWKNSYTTTKIELKREEGLTESAIEPLKLQLARIEFEIKDQIEMMDLARVDVMENDEKILKLLKEM